MACYPLLPKLNHGSRELACHPRFSSPRRRRSYTKVSFQTIGKQVYGLGPEAFLEIINIFGRGGGSGIGIIDSSGSFEIYWAMNRVGNRITRLRLIAAITRTSMRMMRNSDK